MDSRLVASDDTRIGFEVVGKADGQPLVFLHSLGSSHRQWQPQVEVLSATCRILLIDTRGHGISEAPTGDYTLARLAADVLEVADANGFGTFHLCGLSLGGMMGQWIAIHHPDRLRSLTLANTAARIGSAEVWNDRIDSVRTHGLESMADAVLSRWFTTGFTASNEALIDRTRATLVSTTPDGYAGCCAAIRDADLRAHTAQISARTLLIGARHDPATPPSDLEYLHTHISGSHLVMIEDASHISNLEAPTQFTAALRAHLQG
jgi:3-oxoadipate enol-lactonase